MRFISTFLCQLLEASAATRKMTSLQLSPPGSSHICTLPSWARSGSTATVPNASVAAIAAKAALKSRDGTPKADRPASAPKMPLN
jgi:hypothetical protein